MAFTVSMPSLMCFASYLGLIFLIVPSSPYLHMKYPSFFFLLILDFRIDQLHPWKVPCFKGKCNVGTCTV